MMGPPFVSPMGEPFRASGDSGGDAAWFAGADTNKDGVLSADEMMADAARFFATLDTDGDGRLNGTEQSRYETEVAPFIMGGGGGWRGGRRGGGRRGGGSGGGFGGMDGGVAGDLGDEGGGESSPGRPDYDDVRQGAGRFGYLNVPEPVSSADTDLNFVVTQKEFLDTARSRFRLLDANHDGKIMPAELPQLAQPRRRR
jgi:hypothetical protein